MGERVTAYRQ